ncbi:hypothetical protein C7452_1270 [Methanothermobacter defluvii]|uniref:Uncharacterized protein n=1 Tax=Methanothermobacter defluvii TaxID=49339 RepID=A0A371NBA5_9EURY|nr:hypothetical protein C7452_1270 [Methanothermobacter defluvii]
MEKMSVSLILIRSEFMKSRPSALNGVIEGLSEFSDLT